MINKRNLLIVVVILVVGVFMVAAQDDDNTPSFFKDWQNHGGMMGNMMQNHGGMMGMMFSDFEHPEGTMHTAIAEALGIEEDALYAAMSEGKTIAEIAEEQGVELSVVSGAMIALASQHMSAMVEAGYLTQDEMNERLAFMSENILTHLTEGGFGGMMGGFGGMMNGFGGMMNGFGGMGYHGDSDVTQQGFRGHGPMGGMRPGGRWN